jgi:hypothetical protein
LRPEHDDPGKHIPMLVEDYNIAETFTLGRADKIWKNKISSVESNSSWEQQPYFFGKRL